MTHKPIQNSASNPNIPEHQSSRFGMHASAKTKWLGLAAIGLLVAVAAYWMLSSKKPKSNPAVASTAHITTLKLTPSTQTGQASFDGVVESVRQSTIAAQVPGNVVEIMVRAGDRVAAGQTLLRIDGQAAEQQAIAARAEFARQQQLYAKEYISKAAFDQAKVQLAAATAQAGFFLIRAPFAGVVSEVHAKLGEMAMPGTPLLQMFDPSAMRVSAQVPQTQMSALTKAANARVELSGMTHADQWLVPASFEILPAVDARTHSGTLRLPMQATNVDLVPGVFARVWVEIPQSAQPTAADTASLVSLPMSAVVRRGEINAVYVKTMDGSFVLRQIRLGQPSGQQVQVLSGLSAGDEIATDPQAAANTTQAPQAGQAK